MLSSYFFARRAQEEARRAQEEIRRADEANRRADEEARLRQTAEAEVQALKAQLARASGARRRRRRLRNSVPQEAP